MCEHDLLTKFFFDSSPMLGLNDNFRSLLAIYECDSSWKHCIFLVSDETLHVSAECPCVCRTWTSVCAGFTPLAVCVCVCTRTSLLWSSDTVFKLCTSAVSVYRWDCLWPSGWQQCFGSSSRCMCLNGTWAGPRLGSLISLANTVTSSLFLSHSFCRLYSRDGMCWSHHVSSDVHLISLRSW